MIRDVLQSISGVATFPVIALLLFFVFFLGVILWTTRMDKRFVKKMACMPLDSDDKTMASEQ